MDGRSNIMELLLLLLLQATSNLGMRNYIQVIAEGRAPLKHQGVY
jgi:hypothetical protein